MVSERTYLGTAGQPTLHSAGYAGYRSQFDSYGNEITRTFFAASGQPTKNLLGKSGWRARFAQWGHKLGRDDF